MPKKSFGEITAQDGGGDGNDSQYKEGGHLSSSRPVEDQAFLDHVALEFFGPTGGF